MYLSYNAYRIYLPFQMYYKVYIGVKLHIFHIPNTYIQPRYYLQNQKKKGLYFCE